MIQGWNKYENPGFYYVLHVYECMFVCTFTRCAIYSLANSVCAFLKQILLYGRHSRSIGEVAGEVWYRSGLRQGYCIYAVLNVCMTLWLSTGGMWPAMWLLGNLARATYVGSSNNVWPWSYDTCSKTLQKQQLVSACNVVVSTSAPFNANLTIIFFTHLYWFQTYCLLTLSYMMGYPTSISLSNFSVLCSVWIVF